MNSQANKETSAMATAVDTNNYLVEPNKTLSYLTTCKSSYCTGFQIYGYWALWGIVA